MPGGPGPAETGPAGAGPAETGPAGAGPAEAGAAGAGPRSRAGGPGRWWRRRSLRARVTLASTAGLALALAAAAVLLSGALRLSLIRSLDNSARQGAQGVAALSDAGRLPAAGVPVGAGTITAPGLDSRGRLVNV